MAKTLPISEAKTKLGEWIAGLEAGDEEVVITRNGRQLSSLRLRRLRRSRKP
jgi:antitoxin (DNA-binding transcriptional repressor) of toxin-antitoxin stability system